LERPFISILLTSIFLVVGILLLFLATITLTAPPTKLEAVLAVLTTAATGIAYIAVAYGLYKMAAWGWALALAISALNLFSLIYYGGVGGTFLYAALIVLLLIASKHYIKKSPIKPTPSPAPVPTTPLAVALIENPKTAKFVRRRS